MAQTTPRVLLSAPIRPFGVDNEVCTREMNYDALTDNAGGGDGLFVPRGVSTTPATHFIANNLNAPSVVLDFASTEELKNELKKGYEFFGISFMTCDLLKAKKMVEIAREVSPRTKIVLGGYGTQTPGVENFGADHICERDDGVAFMKKLLGQQDDGSRKNPFLPTMPRLRMLGFIPGGFLDNSVHFVVGFGCTRGCEFCVTSNVWGRKYHPALKTGKEMHDEMYRLSNGASMPTTFISNQDDFLLDKERNMELWEYNRTITDNPFRYMCFTSAAAVSQYDPETLLEMGADLIFMGVETLVPDYDGGRVFNPIKHKVPGSKKVVDIRKLFKNLNEHGIKTIAASILHVPSHTEENVVQDIEYNLSMNTTLSQFSGYQCFPGTPLWNRFVREKRLYFDPNDLAADLNQWLLFDGMTLHYQHPGYNNEKAAEIRNFALKRKFEEHGPMIVRMFSTNLKGYLRYKDSTSPTLRAKAESWRKQIIMGLPILMAANDPKFGNSPKVRSEVKGMLNTISKEVISPSVFHRMMEKGIVKAAERWQKKIDAGEDKVDESLYRREYNMEKPVLSLPFAKEKIKEKIANTQGVITQKLTDQYVRLNEKVSNLPLPR